MITKTLALNQYPPSKRRKISHETYSKDQIWEIASSNCLEKIKEVLEWTNTPEKLALLTAPIQGNGVDFFASGNDYMGLNFFTYIAAYSDWDKIKTILDWANTYDKLALLTTPINNDSSWDGYNFFTCRLSEWHSLDHDDQVEIIKTFLDWADSPDKATILATPIQSEGEGEADGCCFFNLVPTFANSDSIKTILDWADSPEKVALLSTPIQRNSFYPEAIGYNFFTRIAAYGWYNNIQEILKWADTPEKQALLTDPIQNNDSFWGGYNFFTMVGQRGNSDTIRKVLVWANTSEKLNFLTAPVENNDRGFNGFNFFTIIATAENPNAINHTLDWIKYSLKKGLNLNMLFSPINNNLFTFFHIIAKKGSTENCISMAEIILSSIHRSPVDHDQAFLNYFKENLLHNPLNLGNAAQSGLDILLSREDRKQVIDPYIQPVFSLVSPLTISAYIETSKGKQIQDNDKDNEFNFYTMIANTENPDAIKNTLDWIKCSLKKGLDLNILFSPTNDNLFTFFHIIAKKGSTENCISMAEIILSSIHRSPVDHDQAFLNYFKENLLHNPLNLGNAAQSGLDILLSREDRKQVIDPYIQPVAPMKSLKLMAFEAALKRVQSNTTN